MIQRKTYRADLERIRPWLFFAAIVIIATCFLAVSNIQLALTPSTITHKDIEDIALNIKMLPLPEQDKNVISAKVAGQQRSNKINIVDEVKKEKTDIIKEKIKFDQIDQENIEDFFDSETDLTSIQTKNKLEDAPLRIVEELPEFPGGMSAFIKWLTKALKYPQRSKQLKQQGTVVVSFVVEKDGTTSNIKFIKQTHTSLDAEVLRVLRIMPKWSPAKKHGQPCRAVIAIPFVFAI